MERGEIISRLKSGGLPLRIHLIGVAGSGMSGLAALLMDFGHTVSGSDKVTTTETERLQKVGLQFSSPHTAEAVAGVEVVVFSSAIRAGNFAYDAAVAAGVPMLRRAEALAVVMQTRKGIVVAGTHGKTTTSAMAAHVLRGGGLNPSHYVGAEIPILGTNAALGDGEYFVAEGDESDGTLVQFHPEHTIILNVEAEHLDHYTDGIDGIRKVFETLLDQTAGTFFYCVDDPGASGVCAGREGAVSYGLGEGCAYRAEDLSVLGQSSSFVVVKNGEPLGPVVLNIPGQHNVLNALAVVALATELGVPFVAVRDALGTFRGAKRRFETRFSSRRYRVVDDYGHHPTEIAATIATARTLGPSRIICLFQPHRYTRTKLLRDEFGCAFDGADALFVTDIYPASEQPISGISGQTVVDAVAGRGHCGAFSVPGMEEATLALGNHLRPGDLVLTLGAGNIHEVAGTLARDLDVLERVSEVLGDEDYDLRLYEPMSRHTTIRIGGPAQYWISVRSVAGLASVVRLLRAEGVPVKVVGRGSNLLVRDGGIRGAVIHPSKGEFSQVHVRGDTVTAGVGARFKKVSSEARSAGLGGFEWMEGIPGNVGGGLRMNAGAMGVQTFDQVLSVRFVDPAGKIFEKSRDEIVAHYRDVPELDNHYAVSAVFRGEPDTIGAIDARLKESKAKRKTSQPIAASAGCIFKNPAGVPAGQLVEELGLKESAVGAASVSSVHGNFIVNNGGARAADVLGLIARIREAAEKQRGITVETEVQVIGEDRTIL